jgi:TonB family protein
MTASKWAALLAVLTFAASLAFARQDTPKSDAQSKALADADQLDVQVGTLFKQQQFDKALPLAQRELMLRENALGPNHPAVADVSRNIAELYFAKAKYKDAYAAYRRFLQVYESAYGADSPKLLDGLYRYTSLLITTNQRAEALEIQKHAFRIENGVEFEKLVTQKNKNLPLNGLISGLMTFSTTPTFPQDAKRAGIYGSVVIRLTVDESGKVDSLKVLSGHPLLTEVSELAARRSTYAPALLEGKPMKVSGILIYNFLINLTDPGNDHTLPTADR